MLEKGIKYPGEFWITSNELSEFKFFATLDIRDDNFNYLEFDLPIKLNKVYNAFINNQTYTIQGNINNQKVTLLNAYYKKSRGEHFLIKSYLVISGDDYYEESYKIKEAQAKFSLFKSRIAEDKEENQNIKIHDDSITYIQYYSDLRDGGTRINFLFYETKNIDEINFHLEKINNFFSLINNVPSSIEEFQIVVEEVKTQFDINSFSIPIDTLNNRNIAKTNEIGLINLHEKLTTFIDFLDTTKIASEQYFVLQKINRKYYSEMILYNAIFAFEGFLNAYNERINSTKALISTEKHNSICEKIIFPFIENLDKSNIPEIDDDYIQSLKEGIKYSYEKSFRKRLKEFYSRNKIFFENDFLHINTKQNVFIDNILAFRNTYAHNSDKELDKINNIESFFDYYLIINKSIRVLILHDLLMINDEDFQN